MQSLGAHSPAAGHSGMLIQPLRAGEPGDARPPDGQLLLRRTHGLPASTAGLSIRARIRHRGLLSPLLSPVGRARTALRNAFRAFGARIYTYIHRHDLIAIAPYRTMKKLLGKRSRRYRPAKALQV